MRPIHILLVEDNGGDIILTLEPLKEATLSNNVSIAGNGEQAIPFLNKETIYEATDIPGLVPDINLPGAYEREELPCIKTHFELKNIPVKIQATSVSERDVTKSYERYANCYILKPAEPGHLFEVIKRIEHFRTSIVHLPKNSSHVI